MSNKVIDGRPLRLLRELVASGWRLHPELSQGRADSARAAFEALISYAEKNPTWSVAFNDAGKAWKQRSRQQSMENTGYFGPYFRNLIGQEGKDQKITYQTCPSFAEELSRADYPGELAVLDAALFDALAEVVPYMQEVVEAILVICPGLRTQFYDDQGRARLSVRALKYVPDALAGTNPHVDKSALTTIMYTSDSAENQSLVLCPPLAGGSDLNDYCQASNDPTTKNSVVFAGAALTAAGFELLQPLPHAVMPVTCRSPRFSLVAFWLLQGVDLGSFDTTVFITSPNPSLRRYRKKTISSAA